VLKLYAPDHSGNVTCNDWKTDSKENFNIQPKKKMKHRTPGVKIKGSAYSSVGCNRPYMAWSIMILIWCCMQVTGSILWHHCSCMTYCSLTILCLIGALMTLLWTVSILACVQCVPVCTCNFIMWHLSCAQGQTRTVDIASILEQCHLLIVLSFLGWWLYKHRK
jgi:CHASE2 domain-containing sensor protein